MYWQEEEDQEYYAVPDDIVDVVFGIECQMLPVDHAYGLSAGIRSLLPWFEEEEAAGVHLIHGADSGNGWERPEEAGEMLYLSRRTKLTLRLPKGRVQDARALSGQTIEVSGCRIHVKEGKSRLLAVSTTVYSRYVVTDPDQGEEAFLEQAIKELRARGMRFKKILCGKENALAMPEGALTTRSVLVGDLPVDDAVNLQQVGLGTHRKMGCGLFIPHKPV